MLLVEWIAMADGKMDMSIIIIIQVCQFMTCLTVVRTAKTTRNVVIVIFKVDGLLKLLLEEEQKSR
jgi:hypothetical protein